MRKYSLILMVFAFCSSCDSNGRLNENKINEAGDKLQKTVEKGADSLGSKVERLKDSLVKDDDNNQ